MVQEQFKAFVVEEKDGNFVGGIQTKSLDELPEGDLLLRVHYSSLNYKDALSASGNKGVTKNYPHTPGIDAVGTVVSCKSGIFQVQQKVIVTSYDLGMNIDGGFAEFIRVPEAWALALPDNLSMKEAMILGTAGLTAGLSVLKLSEKIKPKDGEVVVSGATGGVGSLSILILAKLGYSVTAISGKENEQDLLLGLGASNIIFRKDFAALANKPLLKTSFAGGIDTVGGLILENIIKSTQANGVVTCCGNVASPQLNLTVFPFILRGLTLIGIDSQNCPMSDRIAVWHKLATDFKPQILSDACTEITLSELSEKLDLMLQGEAKGRCVLKLKA